MAVEPGHSVLKHIVYSLEPWYLSHAPVRLFKDSTKKPFDYSKLQQAGACYCGNLLSIRHHPGNIRLEDVFRLQKTSSRRLDQDEYVLLSLTSSRCLGKTNIFDLAIRLQDVLPRRLQEVLPKVLQDIFKMYHQVKLFLLTRL